jgi:hypothetical protein
LVKFFFFEPCCRLENEGTNISYFENVVSGSPVDVARVVALQYGADCNHIFAFDLQFSDDGDNWTTAMMADFVPYHYDSYVNMFVSLTFVLFLLYFLPCAR